MYYSQHNAAAQQHPTYHAPLLKTAVIIQCMHEMEIPMSEHELLAPERHKEPTKQVFVRLVRACASIFVRSVKLGRSYNSPLARHCDGIAATGRILSGHQQRGAEPASIFGAAGPRLSRAVRGCLFRSVPSAGVHSAHDHLRGT